MATKKKNTPTKSSAKKDGANCSNLKNALEILGDRWSSVILWNLNEKSQRFCELEESTGGINPRTLTARLKMLEEADLITREEFQEYPPRTEYTITKKGRDLKPIFTDMMSWAAKYSK